MTHPEREIHKFELSDKEVYDFIKRIDGQDYLNLKMLKFANELGIQKKRIKIIKKVKGMVGMGFTVLFQTETSE